MIHVVLPAYNEEANLPGLLQAFAAMVARQAEPCRIYVVDDGSTDSTARVARGFVGGLDVQVVSHQANRGLGEALRTGFCAALKAAQPDDAVITMDSDNTHSPDYIPAMVQKLREENLDMVVASRYRQAAGQQGVPGMRRFLSGGGNLLFRLALRLPGLLDYTCGYRCFRASRLREAMEMFGPEFVTRKDFSVTGEITLRMRRVTRAFGEVPFVLHYERKQGTSKMRVLRTVLSTLRLLLRG